MVRMQPGIKEADGVKILTFLSSCSLIYCWYLLLTGFKDKPEGKEIEAGEERRRHDIGWLRTNIQWSKSIYFMTFLYELNVLISIKH